MEKAATDIYTFESLRNGGFTYIDKTAILKELADLALSDSDRAEIDARLTFALPLP